jgi:hypothetical protein
MEQLRCVSSLRGLLPGHQTLEQCIKNRCGEKLTLKILLRELYERDLRYVPVTITESADGETPGITDEGLKDIRLTDRDVILVLAGYLEIPRTKPNPPPQRKIPVLRRVPFDPTYPASTFLSEGSSRTSVEKREPRTTRGHRA